MKKQIKAKPGQSFTPSPRGKKIVRVGRYIRAKGVERGGKNQKKAQQTPAVNVKVGIWTHGDGKTTRKEVVFDAHKIRSLSLKDLSRKDLSMVDKDGNNLVAWMVLNKKGRHIMFDAESLMEFIRKAHGPDTQYPEPLLAFVLSHDENKHLGLTAEHLMEIAGMTDMKAKDSKGNSMLHVLASHPYHLDKNRERIQMFSQPQYEYLIKQVKDINSQGEYGNTALHLAALQTPQMMAGLMRAGADPMVANHYGTTALDMDLKSERIIQSIMEQGKLRRLVVPGKVAVNKMKKL